MHRLVHFAPVAEHTGITERGIRGAELTLGSSIAEHEWLERALFAVPLLLGDAHEAQLRRDAPRLGSSALVGVQFMLPHDEPVLLSMERQRPLHLSLDEAMHALKRSPSGAELLVPRAISACEVLAVHPLSVHQHVPVDCVCERCVKPRDKDLLARLKAAFQRQLEAAHSAETPLKTLYALHQLETPLRRAQGRLPASKLLPFAGAVGATVRAQIALLYRLLPWAQANAPLMVMLNDSTLQVRIQAIDSLVCCGGLTRAYAVVRQSSEQNMFSLLEHIEFYPDRIAAAQVLLALSGDGSLELRAEAALTAQMILAHEQPTSLSERWLRRVAAAT